MNINDDDTLKTHEYIIVYESCWHDTSCKLSDFEQYLVLLSSEKNVTKLLKYFSHRNNKGGTPIFQIYWG